MNWVVIPSFLETTSPFSPVSFKIEKIRVWWSLMSVSITPEFRKLFSNDPLRLYLSPKSWLTFLWKQLHIPSWLVEIYGVQISGKLQVYIFIHSSQVFIIPGQREITHPLSLRHKRGGGEINGEEVNMLLS